MELIQNAYQGFSKQNYTMLDNLRLGYGGTQAEMQRLLADAEKLSGVKYDISNLSDVYNAIHVIQQEMGIAGTTAEEAAGTISGSFGSLSAAWENLVTGFADANADLPKLIDDVVEAAEGSFSNMLPVAEQAISGIANFVDNIAPIVADKLPNVIDEIIPPLLSTANTVVNALVASLPTMLRTVVDIVPAVISDISGTVIDLLPEIADLGLDLIISLADGITQSLPELVPAAVSAIDKITNTLTDPETLSDILSSGLDLITALADGIGNSIPQLADTAIDIVINLVDFIIDPENLGKIADSAIKIMASLAEGVINAIPKVLESIADLIVKIEEKITGGDWIGMGEGLLNAIGDGIEKVGPAVMNTFESILGAMDTALGTHLKEWYKEVTDFFYGFGEYLADLGAADTIAETALNSKVSDLRTDIIQTANELARSGVEPVKAFNSAVEEYTQSAENLALYNEHLKDEFNSDFIEQWASDVEAGIKRANEATVKAATAGLSSDDARAEKFSMKSVRDDATAEVQDTFAAVNDTVAEETAKSTDFITKAIGEYSGLGVEKVLGHTFTEAEKEADRIANEVYSASKEYVDRITTANDLSVTDQISWWEKVQNQFVEGSEQYLKAGDKVIDLRKQQSKEAQKAEEDAAKAAEKAAKAAEQAIKDTYTTEAAQIQHDVAVEGLSFDEQIERWTDLLNQFDPGSEYYNKIEETIAGLVSKKADSDFNTAWNIIQTSGLSAEEQKKQFESLLENYEIGSDEYTKIWTKIESLDKQIASNAEKDFNDQLSNIKARADAYEWSNEELLSEYQELQKQYAEGSEEWLAVQAKINDAEDKIASEADKDFKNRLANVKTQADAYSWTAEQILAEYQKLQSQYAEGSEEWLATQIKINDAEDKIASDDKKKFNDKLTNIKDLAKAYNWSNEDLLKAYQEFQSQYAEGTDEWLEIQKNIVDVNEDISADTQKELEAREKAYKEYLSNIEKIQKNIESVQKNYDNKLVSRTQDIYDSYDLFAEVPERVLYSGKDLTNNLENQILSIQKFYSDIDKLSRRGVNVDLVTEIRSKGVGAMDQLDALLDLSDEDLQKYSDLYTEKNDLSARIAENELSGLKAETEDQITDLMNDISELTAEQAGNIGTEIAQGIADGITDGSPKIKEAILSALEGSDSPTLEPVTENTATEYGLIGSETKAGINVAPVSMQANEKTGTQTVVQPEYRDIIVNINGIQYQNMTALASAVGQELQFLLNRKNASYAVG